MTIPRAPKYPDVHVRLSGTDGNVFHIIGLVRRALRRAGAAEEEVSAFTNQMMAATSYDNALWTVMQWVDVS